MKKITKYAKENRKKPTKAERFFRKCLMKNKIKFRTQRMFDFYIVDFLIIDKRIIIELDGSSHIGKEEYDKKRDVYLTKKNFIVKHYSNEIALNNPEKIINFINQNPDIERPSPKDFSLLYGKSAY